MSNETWSIRRLDARQDDAAEELAVLRTKLSPRGDVVSDASRQRTIEVFGEPLTPVQVVEKICRDVQEQGRSAVLDYSSRLDNAQLQPEQLRVPSADLESAHAAAAPEFLATVRRIRDRVRRFQSAILHQDVEIPDAHGGVLQHRYRPLRRVGLCIPGGAAAYPSTVLMTAVPAQAAGVQEIAVVAPPTKNGAYNQDLLATCHELGLNEVYRVGGAQGVAALAYGVEGIAQVDKIVGPGNLFVALAKKNVFGEVDIDSIAGPSEVVVIADETVDANHVALDLIAQAEHAPGASLLLVWSEQLLEQVAAALREQLQHLERGELARQSLEEFGALILTRDAEHAAQLAREIAPEHLHLQIEDADSLLEAIPTAGAVFVGKYSPVAVGDYIAGPSHVLPTSGTARFASGLSANDFLRSHAVMTFTREGLAAVAPDVGRLAEKEGLTAHKASVDIRLT